ncbi:MULTISPECIES: CDP-alcohol phosphatidyltransferase family protein [unclassified Modestobacter]|uniref:CDP-alcohol phosphatidyltransferase family protein n=1 Tax=unclassified Modestobacter TaxID=2643866 RepID=UPI0022AAF0EB|nr:MULTISPECIES: CDP-alcohol phosphatidyltransferase family protein [unclassified Modestobacter]MCZ2825180.1 CDP-alcohol phosphatidyltransferase family protein [Modestobacter sp. VKM Ac-2981]MCZ2853755.1 CDP-alcohol phosphatidyltransferase family protein [Modestobacter sp. VKM Ac-2982]
MSAVLRSEAPSGRSETFQETLARLAGAQKGALGAPAYSRFVNRKLGRFLAAVAFHVGLSPNQVTAISAAFSATGITLLALVAPSWAMGVAVSACLVLGYALDAADGQLARLRGGGSPAGEWLDHMVDAVKASSLHLAVLIGLYRFVDLDSRGWLLVPLGYCVVDAVLYFGTMLNDALRAQHGVPIRSQQRGERPSVVRSLLVLPTDYGLLCCVFVLFGAPMVFLSVYTALFVAMTAFLALASVKWFREMGRLPR